MSDDQDLTASLGRAVRRDFQAPEGGHAAAVRTARRRSAAGVAGVVGMVAALVVGVPMALSGETSSAPVPVATRVTTPTPSVPEPSPASSFVLPTQPSTPGPSAAGPAPSGPAAAALVLDSTGTAPLSAGTLAGLEVRDVEPGGAYSGDPGAEVQRGPTTWHMDPCRDGGPSSDAARTGFYSAVVSGSDTGVLRQAATYAGAAQATAALGELLEEVRRCGEQVPQQVWAEWDRLGDEPARVVSYDVAVGQDAPGPQGGGLYRLLLVDDALLVAGRDGLYVGTDVAAGLGDTRPEVGPDDWADGGATTDQLFRAVDRGATTLAEDVAAHREGDVLPPLERPVADPPPTAADLPAEAAAVHGGRYWGVFAAVAYDASDPRLTEALGQVRALGYQGGTGDVACTQGAVETLGLDPQRFYTAVSVLFDSREAAQQFVDAYEPGVVGTAEVTAYCLD